MLRQSFAGHIEEIGQQRQAATRGQQQDQLARRRRRLHAIQKLLHDRALVSGRNDRVRQRALQVGMLLYEPDERRKFLFGAFWIGLFEGNVEQRFGISRC
jgi:hypothetical protein